MRRTWAGFWLAIMLAAIAERFAVHVNGERLPEQTLSRLEQAYQTEIPPGRYSLDAFGIGGREGGPPQIDLRSRGLAAGGGYNRNTPGGSLMSDGAAVVTCIRVVRRS